MSDRLPSARTIAERALRKIGAFPITETAADGEELDEALFYLDFIIRAMGGAEMLQWLIQRPFVLPLEANKATYDMSADFVGILPADGIQYPIGAFFRRGQSDWSAEWLRRTDYDAIPTKARTGSPAQLFLDRREPGHLSVYPVPGDDTWELHLTAMVYAPDQQQDAGNVPSGMPEAWTLWMVTTLAAEIGDGPVRRLPLAEIRDWREVSEGLRHRLLAHHNRQRAGGGFVRARDV